MFVYVLCTILNVAGTLVKFMMFIVVHVAITLVHDFKFKSITFLFSYINVVNSLPNLEITILNKNFITFVHVLSTFIKVFIALVKL